MGRKEERGSNIWWWTDLTLGAGNTIQYTDDVCMELYAWNLHNVISQCHPPIHLIKMFKKINNTLPWLFWPYSRWFTGPCRFFTSQCQRLCLFGEINCYFYIDADAEPTLQESLIALEFLQPFLSYKVWISFPRAGSVVRSPVAFCHGHCLLLLVLILFLLDLISCCSWHLLQPDKLTAPIVNLAQMLSFPGDGKERVLMG